MTLDALRKRMLYWQDRLNLREWKLTLHRRPNKGTLGCVLWNPDELTASIWVKSGIPDEEGTLIHELLHIVIQGHEVFEKHDVSVERAINRIVAALQNKGEKA